jgi:hypothetical protein
MVQKWLWLLDIFRSKPFFFKKVFGRALAFFREKPEPKPCQRFI